MTEFCKISLENSQKFRNYFSYQKTRTCDYTFGSLIMWQEYFQTEFAIVEEMLVLKSTLNDGTEVFAMPLGPGRLCAAIDFIEEYTERNKIPLVFTGITEKEFERAQKCVGKDATYHPSRDWSDYLYTKESLTELKGKKYHSKRNHISAFKRAYPQYQYHAITADNIAVVQAFFEEYLEKNPTDDQLELSERKNVLRVLKRFEEYQFLGGFIEVDGKAIAFSLGEIIGDTLFVHVEKANRDYHGSFAIINQEFALACADEHVNYINREEDVGDEGLRKAKLSYHPVEIIIKGFVRFS